MIAATKYNFTDKKLSRGMTFEHEFLLTEKDANGATIAFDNNGLTPVIELKTTSETFKLLTNSGITYWSDNAGKHYSFFLTPTQTLRCTDTEVRYSFYFETSAGEKQEILYGIIPTINT